jgi:hypothetical protein
LDALHDFALLHQRVQRVLANEQVGKVAVGHGDEIAPAVIDGA